MAEAWVVNASPIIVLAKIGQLRLIPALANTVLVPNSVAQEIMSGPASDPARMAIEGGWGVQTSIAQIPSEIMEWGLGIGEASVIAIAQSKPSAIAVMDDALGRSCARSMSVPVIGTLGVILRAKKRGLISSFAQSVREIKAAGLFFDDNLLEELLKTAGE